MFAPGQIQKDMIAAKFKFTCCCWSSVRKCYVNDNCTYWVFFSWGCLWMFPITWYPFLHSIISSFPSWSCCPWSASATIWQSESLMIQRHRLWGIWPDVWITTGWGQRLGPAARWHVCPSQLQGIVDVLLGSGRGLDFIFSKMRGCPLPHNVL